MSDELTPLGGDETRAKYTAEEVNALGAKGHAFKNDGGDYSYPIDDLEDLRNAIHAVGRGNASHDAIRKYVIHMAGVLSATDEIPDNWNPDGSLKDAVGVKASARRSAGDLDDERTSPFSAREALSGLRETRRMPFEMREVPNGHGGTDLLCSGYASVTCPDTDDLRNAYEMEDWLGTYKEATIRGFAQKSIQEGCDTVFWANHGEGGAIPMARTKAAGNLKLFEDLTGLGYEARLNASRADVKVLRAAVDDGIITESSFAFRVLRQEWNQDYTQRFIREVTLDRGDVSPVTFGANPRTGDYPLSMRSAYGALLTGRGLTFESWCAALQDLTEQRAGKKFSQSTMDVLQPLHDHLAAMSDMVSQDHPALAELLGFDDASSVDEASDGESLSSNVYVLPDFTHRAQADLAAMRRR